MNRLNFIQQRKRAVTIHVSDQQGNRLQGAALTVDQVSKDFPFGSAIASTVLGNLPYQVCTACKPSQCIFPSSNVY